MNDIDGFYKFVFSALVRRANIDFSDTVETPEPINFKARNKISRIIHKFSLKLRFPIIKIGFF